MKKAIAALSTLVVVVAGMVFATTASAIQQSETEVCYTTEVHTKFNLKEKVVTETREWVDAVEEVSHTEWYQQKQQYKQRGHSHVWHWVDVDFGTNGWVDSEVDTDTFWIGGTKYRYVVTDTRTVVDVEAVDGYWTEWSVSSVNGWYTASNTYFAPDEWPITGVVSESTTATDTERVTTYNQWVNSHGTREVQVEVECPTEEEPTPTPDPSITPEPEEPEVPEAPEPEPAPASPAYTG